MIDYGDTLICENMIFWTDIDSINAQGNVQFNQKNRTLTSSIINYWKGNGYRGSSFTARGDVQIFETDREVKAEIIKYDDVSQQMILEQNAMVSSENRSLLGQNMIIQYTDSLLNKISIQNDALATNLVEAKIDSYGVFQKFRDEMNSSNMNAYFSHGDLSFLIMAGMANTELHVIEDSLYMGKNIASGDSIIISFENNELHQIQVNGGGRGKFEPEPLNASIDSTVTYASEFIDYHIQNEESFFEKNAVVNYQGSILKAGHIRVDWQTNLLDATEKNGEQPSVKTGTDAPIVGDNFKFDLNSKHGVIKKGKTSLNDSYYHGEEIFRDEPNIIHVNNSIYTSCDLDKPHYYLGSKQMKMLPGDRIIARPLWLHIYDIPIIGVPLAVFPNKGGGRRSGWIMPSFGSSASRGSYLRHLGYFWAPNDYVDGKVLISFYDEHGTDSRSTFNYKKRYKYNGNLNISFLRKLQGTNNISAISSDSTSQNWDLRWKHSHNIDPTQNLNINYTYVSSNNYYQETGYDLETRLKQQINSSLNYSKSWTTWKNSLSLNLSETYDLLAEDKKPETIGGTKFYKNRSIPNMSFRHGHSALFGLGDHLYNSIYWSSSSNYNGNQKIGYVGQPNSTWTDTTVFTKGINHNISLSAPQKFFGWLSINPNLSLKEDWVFEYREPLYGNDGNFNGEFEKIEGFNRRLTGSASLSANTKMYGIFPFPIANSEAIRHVVTPSISYSYRPDFSESILGLEPRYILFDNEGGEFDPFAGSTAGATSTKEQKNISLSLQNLFQMKIRKEDKIKKVDLLSWKIKTGYNAAADDFKWSTLRSTFKTTIPGGLKLDISTTHDVYERNNGIRVDRLTTPYLSKMDASTSFRISGNRIIGFEDPITTNVDTTDFDDELLDMNESDLAPKMAKGSLWQASFSMRYSKQQKLDYNTDIYEWDNDFWLNTNLKIMLSENWKLSYNTRFDVVEQKLLSQSLHLSRPLHCWEFTFKWWPSGGSKGFFLNISVKHPDLQDIKIESRGGTKRIFGI
jgi:lipopolysaccharide export system protein LptA